MFKNLTKYILASALILSIFTLTFTSSEAAPKKRVLIEQHTGAWCGWCPDGTVVIEELIKKYPDQVIGVKFHNGDNMAISEQGAIGQVFGLQGFPSGMVDRKSVGNEVFLDRGAWESVVYSIVNEAPKVDVSVSFKIEGTKLTATVSCEALVDITEQLAFNVFVCEDQVTGWGTGWDQSNYFSKNASYPNHPYYSKPKTIQGYLHQAVVRAVLGGPLGDITKFSAQGITKGTKLTQDFVYDLPDYFTPEMIYVVGLVQERVVSGTSLQKFGILNTAEAQKPTSTVEPIYIKSSGLVYLTPTSSEKVADVTISNPNSYEIDADISLSSLSVIPQGWTAEPANNKVKLNANSDTKVQFKVNCDKNLPGYAVIVPLVKPTSSQGKVNNRVYTIHRSINDNAKYIVFENSGQNSAANIAKYIVANDDRAKKTLYLPYATDLYNLTNSLDLDFLSLSLPFSSNINGTSTFASGLRSRIKSMLDNGKRVILANDIGVSFESSAYSSGIPSDAVKQYYADLGINKKGAQIDLIELTNGYISDTFTKNITSSTGLPSSNLSFTVSPNNSATGNGYWMDNIEATGIAKPFLKVNDGGIFKDCAALVDNGNGRMVYLGFYFDAVESTKRDALAKVMVDWLYSTNDVKDDNTSLANVEIYPNPVNSVSVVKFNNNNNEATATSINLIDMTGRTIANVFNGIANPGVNIYDLNSINIASGTYYLNIETNGFNKQVPVVIAK